MGDTLAIDQAVAPPFPARDVELADRTVTVRAPEPASSELPPSLMVHGLGGSSLNWTDLMVELQSDLAVEAVDLPGFGYSPPPPDGDYTLRAHALVVSGLIARQQRGPVHLFGNSMGGAVALQVAARFPHLVKTLTLVSPALPQLAPRSSSIHLPVLSVPGLGERLVQRFSRADPTWRAQATIDQTYADPASVHPQRMSEAVAEVRRRDASDHAHEALLQSLRGLLASYRDTSQTRPWRLAERVVCPVLVVHGRRDQLVDPRGADRAHRHFADVDVVVLPHCGHVAQMEHPELVAERWREFAAKAGQGAPGPDRADTP